MPATTTAAQLTPVRPWSCTTSWSGRSTPARAAGSAALSLQILSDFAGVIALAEPRWQALEGIRDSERALLRLAGPLANSHFELEDLAAAGRYVERRVFLAEAVGDPEQLAKAMINMGGRYQGTGGPRISRALYEGAADVARTHDLPGALAHALINLSTVLMSRDLPAAIDALFEARDMARRAGVSGMADYAAGNYSSALWSAGRLAESRQVVQEAVETATTPTVRWGLAVVDAYLADAQGEPLPPLPDIETALSVWDLAARGSLDVLRLQTEGDVQGAAALAEATLSHQLSASGLEDDFMHFWPPLVRAAVAAADVPLAERLLEPVAGAAPGLLSTAVAAHLRHLQGLVGAARGDEPRTVEADLRAGVAALADFGALGWSARAEEDLARWLASQGRAFDAAPHLEHARATYAQIGATGWLRRLDSFISSGLAEHAGSTRQANRDLTACHRADLCGAPGPQYPAVRVQEHRSARWWTALWARGLCGRSVRVVAGLTREVPALLACERTVARWRRPRCDSTEAWPLPSGLSAAGSQPVERAGAVGADHRDRPAQGVTHGGGDQSGRNSHPVGASDLEPPAGRPAAGVRGRLAGSGLGGGGRRGGGPVAGPAAGRPRAAGGGCAAVVVDPGAGPIGAVGS